MRLLVTTLLLSTLWILVLSSGPRDKIFFLQKSYGEDNQTLLVVTWADKGDEITAGCEVFSDEDLINEVLKSSNDKRIRKISEEEMNSLLEDCTEISMRRRRRQSGGYPDSRGPPPRHGNSRDMDREGGSYRDFEDRDGPSRNMNNRDGYSIDVSNRDDNNEGRHVSSNRENQRVSSSNSNRRRASEDNSAGRNPARGQYAPDREDSDPSSNEISDDAETTTSSEEMNAAPATEGAPQWPIIWPGTKWCGSGDIAKNHDDLGLHEDTDRCCRAHDLCNDTLLAGESKHNLTNKSPFTKLSCQCDEDFHSCLDRVNTVISNTIGNLYFNILKRECYKEDYPLTKKCKKYRTFLKITCKEYERDTKAPKVYQWFPAKIYKKIPFPGPLTVTLPF